MGVYQDQGDLLDAELDPGFAPVQTSQDTPGGGYDFHSYTGGTSAPGTHWYDDVLSGAVAAGKYLLTGEVAKYANKHKLPNSPKQIQSTAKNWILWIGVVVAVGAIVVIVIKKAK